MSSIFSPLHMHGGGSDLIFPHHENELYIMKLLSMQAPSWWLHVSPLLVKSNEGTMNMNNKYDKPMHHVLALLPSLSFRACLVQAK